MANFSRIAAALKKRAAQIQLLLMDVDGTMTDGRVTLLSETEEAALEIKTFDSQDGQGLTQFRRSKRLRTIQRKRSEGTVPFARNH